MVTETHTHDILTVDFFVGGKALFTVSNGQEHRTFKITKKTFADGKNIFFVSLLTGPDNMSSYTYLGVLNPFTMQVKTTRKSKFAQDSQVVKIVNWSIMMIQEKKTLPSGYSIRHEGKCCRCGRTLTDPISIELGIGPICRG